MEILIIGAIILFLMVYNNKISSKDFVNDNKSRFTLLKEKDYDFLLRAKYGDNVIDPDAVFMKRIRNAALVIIVVLFVFISSLSFLNILIAFVLGYLVFKSPYNDLKRFYRQNLNTIDSLLPYYLKSLEVLVHHYTVPVALAKSIEDAPEVFKPGLKKMVAKIEAGDSSVDPYMQFAEDYPVRDSMRMMRLLYRLGLGEQEKKHEQLNAFARTVSNLQNKAREQKYVQRLETMEKQTMKMLIVTGGGTLLLLLVSIVMVMGSNM